MKVSVLRMLPDTMSFFQGPPQPHAGKLVKLNRGWPYMLYSKQHAELVN